ncbi:YggT family protein [Halioxenophilus sp. WMMB6]|uniref:YggT family protein n=1 Tax=Halioxenophilus sp. WMMB6 TaxID=3073815 RepID=UPI00295F09B7|nr:YggT family protein [Halioxenophilus sp. WMMB6]
MHALAQIATLLIQTLASLFLFFVVLRFLLQLARADIYNPLSKAVVKITSPLLIPLRKVVPGFFGIDLASVVLALLVGLVAIELNLLVVGAAPVNPLRALGWAAIGVVYLTSYMIFAGLIITVIVSWVAPHSRHPFLILLYQLMAPIQRPFQRLIPDLGGLDITPIFIILVINIVWIVLESFARALGLNSLYVGFVPGIV